MQTTKSRNGSSERPKRTSPVTPRTARQLKLAETDSSPVPSPNPSKSLKNRSPRTVERASPRSPIHEKKRISKVSEKEFQLAQLQEELKKAKDYLSSFEEEKKQAQKEAEGTRKQISSLSAKLEESQQQLVELSVSENARLQELRKISHDRDRVWQSELEALQKQHALDTAALASAMNDIQRLKKQLDIMAESESAQSRRAESAHAEIQNLRLELSETLEFVEQMKSQLADSKKSEARAFEVASEAKVQLEATKATAEAVRSDSLKAMEACNSLASDLEQSKAQVSTLENLVSRLQADIGTGKASTGQSGGEVVLEKDGHEDVEIDKINEEIDSLKLEVGELKSALEESEIRYQEEYVQSTLQIRNAYEAVERAKSESNLKETELEEELEKVTDAIEGLKTDLMSKQNTLQYMSNDNEGLSIKILENQTNIKESELRLELKKLDLDLTHLKSAVFDKEVHIQALAEENENLRNEISDREMEQSKVNEEAVALAHAAKAAEKEALMRLGSATDLVDRSNRRATKTVEQLQAAQMENSELEAELRRLKVQADQWRKAAEVAAAMLTPNSDAKLVDRSHRTVSLDGIYHSGGFGTGSPLSDNMYDDFPKKKNANMLKKIGGLWKKNHK